MSGGIVVGMQGEMTVDEVLAASEKGERYLFDELEIEAYPDDAATFLSTYDSVFDFLRETIRDRDMPEDEQYWGWKRHREIDNRIGLGDYTDYPEDYDWPTITPGDWERPSDDRADPGMLTLFPQYFVKTRGASSADVKNGDWVAAIDRHTKYIAIHPGYQDDQELCRGLERFGNYWEQNTTYGSELYNPSGENVPLDYVKILE